MEIHNESIYGSDNKIFVGGFPVEMLQEELHDYMLQFGPVKSSKLLCKRTGESKGFGFVEFFDTESVERVTGSVHILNGKQVNLWSKV